MIAYVLPTRNRPEALARTLDALGALAPHDAEVIVIDNASAETPRIPAELANGLPVTLVRRSRNEGAAGRNAGVRAADPACEWIVMLDDDSRPVHTGFLGALAEQAEDVLAVQAEVRLWGADGDERRRESGGLPEVFVGCGVAIRRRAFLEAGGYDPSFDYYAEEYDLAARFMLAGGRIGFDRRFQVIHDKSARGRSMDRILRRLVRNNAWVMQRYAPEHARRAEIKRTVRRYGGIALRENAVVGYARGVVDLSRTLRAQPRWELPDALWDRFTGRAAARTALRQAWLARRFTSALIVAPGKNEHIVRESLAEMGVRIVDAEADADAVVIGTLSPGPILDAVDRLAADRRLVAPWWPEIGGARATVRAASRTALIAA